MLYAYSPFLTNGYTYDGTLYPGDNFVDIFGVDIYTNNDISTVMDKFEDTYDAATSHGKVYGMTEGLRFLDDYFFEFNSTSFFQSIEP